MKLRDYQERIIAEVRAIFRQGTKSVVIQSPTGSGKTVLTGFMTRNTVQGGRTLMFVVHRRELIRQSAATFDKVGVQYGVIAAGWPSRPNVPVQIASVQTLVRRLHRCSIPDVVVWDECHHNASRSWAKVYDWCRGAYHVGLSATPSRLDGKGLREFFSEMVYGPPVQTLIKEGYLADYKMFCPSNINTSGVHKRAGDYASNELAEVIKGSSIVGDAINEYRKAALGRRAIVFTVNVEEAIRTAESFKSAGIPAIAVSGKTPKNDRDKAFKDFERGAIPILCNCELACEGVDIPGAEVAILMRPTLSTGLFLQQCGRVLRPAPGKEYAVILDHVGNTMRHGLPCDDRSWDLDGIKKKTKSDGPPVKICKHCFAANPAGKKECILCGEPLIDESATGGRKSVEQVDGELEEVNKVEMRRKRYSEQAQARDIEDLVQLGISRGYKKPRAWARYVWKARKERDEKRNQGKEAEDRFYNNYTYGELFD